MKKSLKKNNISRLPITSKGWQDYALVDSGNKCKLERFGKFLLNRFEPDAIWKPALSKTDWQSADATYKINQKYGQWTFRNQPALEWSINVDNLKIALKISKSRHIGIFPEQIENWRWINQTILKVNTPVNILNLFAYTGIATLVAANSDAHVTHVDASKSAIELGKRSQELSHLSEKPIRWIQDDVRKFMLREIRRGNTYDGIIMDPPKFGRGPKGEVWKFEDSIDDLLSISKQLFTHKPIFFLITAYNINMKDEILAEKVRQLMHGFNGNIEYGPLIQLEQSAGRKIEQAHYVRWKNDEKEKT